MLYIIYIMAGHLTAVLEPWVQWRDHQALPLADPGSFLDLFSYKYWLFLVWNLFPKCPSGFSVSVPGTRVVLGLLSRLVNSIFISFFKKFIYLFIYFLFLAALRLRCCAWAFSRDLRTRGGGRVSWDEVREWHGHMYTTKCKIDS